MSAGGVVSEDERLVALARQGDSRAVSELVTCSRPRVRRFAHTLCRSPEDAEEATQEALIVLYRRIGTLRVAAALSGWLFQVVRNECVRRSRIALPGHRPPDAGEPSAEQVALTRLELARIAESIAGLPCEQREVLVLRDLHGLSGADTAERLGLSRAAMKSRLHRARASFRLQLAQDSVASYGETRVRRQPPSSRS